MCFAAILHVLLPLCMFSCHFVCFAATLCFTATLCGLLPFCMFCCQFVCFAAILGVLLPLCVFCCQFVCFAASLYVLLPFCVFCCRSWRFEMFWVTFNVHTLRSVDSSRNRSYQSDNDVKIKACSWRWVMILKCTAKNHPISFREAFPSMLPFLPWHRNFDKLLLV